MYNNPNNINNNLFNNNTSFHRSEVTKQEMISSDINEIKKNLDGFRLIDNQQLKLVNLGSWIKYVSKNGLYRVGGILIVNQAPIYLMLKNPTINKTWSVDLSKNNIYIKANLNLENQYISDKKEIEREKDILYKLYQQGLLEIIEKD